MHGKVGKHLQERSKNVIFSYHCQYCPDSPLFPFRSNLLHVNAYSCFKTATHTHTYTDSATGHIDRETCDEDWCLTPFNASALSASLQCFSFLLSPFPPLSSCTSLLDKVQSRKIHFIGNLNKNRNKNESHNMMPTNPLENAC